MGRVIKHYFVDWTSFFIIGGFVAVLCAYFCYNWSESNRIFKLEHKNDKPNTDYVIFSNDAPLGAMVADRMKPPGVTVRIWDDLNWLGGAAITTQNSGSCLLELSTMPIFYPVCALVYVVLLLIPSRIISARTRMRAFRNDTPRTHLGLVLISCMVAQLALLGRCVFSYSYFDPYESMWASLIIDLSHFEMPAFMFWSMFVAPDIWDY